jgi:P4 family phage/plasmid primase-like protien
MEDIVPNVYSWDSSTSPIKDLHVELGHDPDSLIAISYLNNSGIWNTRHLKLKFADAFAKSLDADQNNVYVMVNEVQSLAPSSSGRGDATQITRLKALWADLDFKDSGLGTPEASAEVISMLAGMVNAEPTAIVFSGYGLQPYWAIDDGEINANNRVYMMGLLKRWGQLVQRVASISGGHVDAVYDLPRVLRAPGTKNYKRADVAVPTQVHFPASARPLSLAEIEEVLTAYGFTHEDNPIDEFIIVSPPESWEPASHDCQWAASLVDEITQSNPKARHPWMVGKAVKVEAAARNGCITSETYSALVPLLRDKFEDLIKLGDNARVPTINEVQSTFVWARALVSTFDEARLAQAVGYHTHKLGELRAVANLPKESANDGAIMQTEGNLALSPEYVQEIAFQQESFAYTDTANASRLAARILGRFIFVPSLGWHYWDGNRYVMDETKRIIQAAIDSAQVYATEDTSETGLKWVKRSLQAGPIKAAVDLAESNPEIVVPARRLDNVARELCTPAGIVSLETGLLREANPIEDYHTKQTNVSPKQMETPMWDKFLSTVIVDQERISYVQELFGLALIGETLHHVLPLFVGTGANGKSTILEVASGLLGDYVAQMPENFLLDKGHQEHSTEIARLRGARLAIGSETRPDGKFNESRVKMLTGGDTISARLIGKNFFDFKPTHTLFLAMNHLPKVAAGGDGFWRRVRKINFDVTIPPEQQDKMLSHKLVEREGAGILQWMIEGAQRVLKDGKVSEPESVLVATNEYRNEEDNIAQFITDRVFINPMMGVSAAELYNNYKDWCARESENAMPRTQLLRELSHRLPLIKEKSRKGNQYTGIGLYEE